MVVTNACAPDPRVLRHARWMQEAGYSVTVHAFDRAEEHAMSENHHGVRIMRYRLGPVAYGGTLNTYRGIRRFHQKVVRTLSNDLPALVYCHDADTLHIGCALKASHGVPFVFDMHDLAHTWVRYAAPNSRLRAAVSGQMKKRMLARAKNAATIITSSAQVNENGPRGFVEWLKHHGLDGCVVENRPMPPFGEVKTQPEDEWTVGYIGRVRDIKAFDLLVQAVKTLPPHERPNIRVAGDGTAAAKVRIMLMEEVEQGHLNAKVSGAFGQEDLHDLLSEVDVMYAMYAPLRGNILQGALPVKMFDAAAQGIPCVVNDDCLMGDLVRSEGLGLAVPWNEPEHIGRALVELKKQVVGLKASGERERKRWLDAMAEVFALIQ